MGAGFVRAMAVAILLSATAEAGVALASGRSREAAAAALLAGSGLVAGGILLIHVGSAYPDVARAMIVAVFIRALAAAVAAVAAQPVGKGWILCRAAAELVLAGVLLASLLAVIVTTPFASLSTVFFGGSASIAGGVLGALLVMTFILAGLSQLLASRSVSGPVQARG